MTLEESVARAICEAETGIDPSTPFAPGSAPIWTHYRDAARAAIAAVFAQLREPSEAMLAAADEFVVYIPEEDDDRSTNELWSAMLTAAQGEGS